jgi:hypothetical protein
VRGEDWQPASGVAVLAFERGAAVRPPRWPDRRAGAAGEAGYIRRADAGRNLCLAFGTGLTGGGRISDTERSPSRARIRSADCADVSRRNRDCRVIATAKPGDFRGEVPLASVGGLARNVCLRDRAAWLVFDTGMRNAGPRQEAYHAIASNTSATQMSSSDATTAGGGVLRPPSGTGDLR